MEQREEVLDYVGRSLRAANGPIAPTVLERLRSLWAFRTMAVEASREDLKAVEELTPFGWWLVSGKFTEEWAIAEATRVLQMRVKLEPSDMVMEFLEDAASRLPREVLHAARLSIDNDREGWGILLWRHHLRTIISRALETKEPSALAMAAEVVNTLGARGYRDFKDLYRPSS